MAGNSSRRKRRTRRVYSDELKAEAVQMMLDGHRA
jgi:transposase-like protein